MGLDMYLQTKSGVEFGYWRKASAVHNWFVTNVQHGKDECEPHVVTKEQLTTLRDLCVAVLEHSKLVQGNVYCGTRYSKDKAERLFEQGQIIEDPSFALKHLPTSAGFFFGGTDYDERYYHKVEDTIKFCNAALAQDEEVIYVSSW